MPAWTKFKVGTPATKGFNSDCVKFDTVSHTSHVDAALGIIERGEIRPYLVFDESILNERRILVSWLSPNFWSNGFRYGNIRFDFDFAQLILGKKFYWVEAIAYKIAACRILVTDQDHNRQLTPYDPSSKKGPWWYDEANERHYFNGNFCLEFMFEDAIQLKSLRTLDFVDHHSSYCSVNRNSPSSCAALGFRASRGGAIFLSRAGASGFDLTKFARHFVRDDGRPNHTLELAFQEIVRKASRKVDFEGDLKATSKNAGAVGRAICAAFSYNNINDAKKLATLFRDETEFDSAIAMVIGETIGLEKWEQLVDI